MSGNKEPGYELAFYYSEKQYELIRPLDEIDEAFGIPLNKPLYNGQTYTECRDVSSGPSTFDDAVLLGYANYSDIKDVNGVYHINTQQG